MKRISEWFVVVCFLAFLAGAMAATVTREEETYSFFENRNLAVRPVYSAQADGDGSYAGAWERYLSDHAAGRNTLLKLKTALDLAARRPKVNDVVVTRARLLPYLPPERVDPAAVSAQAEAMADNLSRIRDTVEGYGGAYCYAAVPCQYAYFSDEYPWYLNNRARYTRLSLEALDSALARRGVDFLDLGAAFDAMGHPEDFGSRVDNHYSLSGAFAAYQILLEHVNARSGLNIPVLGREDVTFRELPNDYLGSRERKLLALERREERLSILEPIQSVPFTRFDNGNETAPTVYALPASEWETLTYSLYMGGDIAQTVIDTGREELPTVLLYGDSFTNAMECVLYLSCDEMHALDLRHYQDMSLEEYILQVKPDLVVCLRDYEALLSLEYNGAGV